LGSIVASRYPSVERLMVAMGDWTNWNVAYRYPDIMPPVPEPSAEELTRALDLISQLADTLRSLGPPAEQDETTQGA
jgi:hypothetical protein